MKRDWESYFNKPNRYGVIPCDWENKNKKNLGDDKVICICPACDNYFIACEMNRVINENDKQIHTCNKCKSIISGFKSRKYNFNIGDILYNNLIVRNIYYKNNHQWACVECSCGNIFDIVSSSLTRNNPTTMCVDCRFIKMGNTIRENHKISIGVKFGLLTTITEGVPFVELDGTKSSTTVCRCECGNIITVRNRLLKCGNTRSCGCLHSWLEALTVKYLTAKEISFTHDFYMKDILTSNGYPCKMDFQIKDKFNNQLAFIECQGRQHYDDSHGDFGRQQREETDALKKEYCREHNILLYEIKFDEDVETRVNEILTELNLIKEAI